MAKSKSRRQTSFKPRASLAPKRSGSTTDGEKSVDKSDTKDLEKKNSTSSTAISPSSTRISNPIESENVGTSSSNAKPLIPNQNRRTISVRSSSILKKQNSKVDDEDSDSSSSSSSSSSNTKEEEKHIILSTENETNHSKEVYKQNEQEEKKEETDKTKTITTTKYEVDSNALIDIGQQHPHLDQKETVLQEKDMERVETENSTLRSAQSSIAVQMISNVNNIIGKNSNISLPVETPRISVDHETNFQHNTPITVLSELFDVEKKIKENLERFTSLMNEVEGIKAEVVSKTDGSESISSGEVNEWKKRIDSLNLLGARVSDSDNPKGQIQGMVQLGSEPGDITDNITGEQVILSMKALRDKNRVMEGTIRDQQSHQQLQAYEWQKQLYLLQEELNEKERSIENVLYTKKFVENLISKQRGLESDIEALTIEVENAMKPPIDLKELVHLIKKDKISSFINVQCKGNSNIYEASVSEEVRAGHHQFLNDISTVVSVLNPYQRKMFYKTLLSYSEDGSLKPHKKSKFESDTARNTKSKKEKMAIDEEKIKQSLVENTKFFSQLTTNAVSASSTNGKSSNNNQISFSSPSLPSDCSAQLNISHSLQNDLTSPYSFNPLEAYNSVSVLEQDSHQVTEGINSNNQGSRYMFATKKRAEQRLLDEYERFEEYQKLRQKEGEIAKKVLTEQQAGLSFPRRYFKKDPRERHQKIAKSSTLYPPSPLNHPPPPPPISSTTTTTRITIPTHSSLSATAPVRPSPTVTTQIYSHNKSSSPRRSSPVANLVSKKRALLSKTKKTQSKEFDLNDFMNSISNPRAFGEANTDERSNNEMVVKTANIFDEINNVTEHNVKQNMKNSTTNMVMNLNRDPTPTLTSKKVGRNSAWNIVNPQGSLHFTTTPSHTSEYPQLLADKQNGLFHSTTITNRQHKKHKSKSEFTGFFETTARPSVISNESSEILRKKILSKKKQIDKTSSLSAA